MVQTKILQIVHKLITCPIIYTTGAKLKAAKTFEKRNLYTIDIADISEVRRGYSTDAFNALEKRIKKFESGENPKQLKFPKAPADRCFSLIFDKRIRTKPLDLVADDIRTCDIWVKTIRFLVTATKNVEVQKEHENFLRKQFQAADSRGGGFLLIDEFADLLRQLNIEQLSRQEIKEIFDQINTDQSTEFDGQQALICYMIKIDCALDL